MRKAILLGLVAALLVIGGIAMLQSQTTNTFPALLHFPGTPTNPCTLTTLAQNDTGNTFWSCGTNLNWYQVGASAGGGLAAPPGVGMPVRFSYVFYRGDGITAFGHGIACLGTQANFSPTATETSGRTITSAAGASTNTVLNCGSAGGANPGQGFISIGTTSRFSHRMITGVTSNFRYWIGVMDASGANYASGNSAFASDAPNLQYCSFRFSSGTDTTWKASCATSSAAQTIVDTGVAPSTTASFIWEITFTPLFAPTQANFFINGAPVATISTNLPATSAGLSYGFMSDNKNTATAGSVTGFWTQAFEK